MPGPDYRPALDGVRALAVAAVIAYHLGLPLTGGYLGVDVFFVLSGYLITGLLLREHQRERRISLTRFWARRARRLLPAVLVLVLVCAAVAYRAPLIDLEPRRDDMIATLLYYANWHLASTDPYFAAFSGASPLRHMWSLAIEEQFYVLWPPIMLLGARLLRRRPAVLLAVLGALAVASAVRMATLYVVDDPSRAYYATDARLHELVVGAMLAVALAAWGDRVGPAVVRALRLAAPIVAAAVVVAVTFLPDSAATYYRGGSLVFAALVAVWLCTLERAPGPAARLLSTPAFVWPGRISYGLYLWHWPLLLWLADSADGQPATWQRQALIVLATVTAATASYVLIEQPIRTGRVPWLRASIPRTAIATPLAVVLVAGMAVAATADPTGMLDRVNDKSVTVCRGAPSCLRQAPDGTGMPVLATLGDSTSLALTPGMVALALSKGWGFVQAGRNGCSFLPLALGGAGGGDAARQAERCASEARGLLARTESAFRPDVWVVQDAFLRSTLYTGDAELRPEDPRRDAIVERALVETVTSLTRSGARVVLVETPPPGEPADCGTRRAVSGCGSPTYSLSHPSTQRMNALLRRVAAGSSGRAVFVPISDVVCLGPRGQCQPLVAGGVLARYDGTHYTATFSRRLAPIIVERAEASGVQFTRR